MSDENPTYSVLVIDDDTDILDVVELGLSRISDLDLITAFASNGEEGLKMCKDFEFDAVITDYFMPNMNGIQFIKEFRKLVSKTIPIIFTSGFFSKLDVHDENLFENVVFLEKPYEISKVHSFIKLYLEGVKLKQG